MVAETTAGKLDRRITLERLGPAVHDGMRAVTAGWLEVGTRAAALMPLNGSERIAAGENAAFQTVKFRIRRPRAFTIDPKTHRFVYRGLPYDLGDVQEIGRFWLDLTGTARADEAEADEVDQADEVGA